MGNWSSFEIFVLIGIIAIGAQLLSMSKAMAEQARTLHAIHEMVSKFFDKAS